MAAAASCGGVVAESSAQPEKRSPAEATNAKTSDVADAAGRRQVLAAEFFCCKALRGNVVGMDWPIGQSKSFFRTIAKPRAFVNIKAIYGGAESFSVGSRARGTVLSLRQKAYC